MPIVNAQLLLRHPLADAPLEMIRTFSKPMGDRGFKLHDHDAAKLIWERTYQPAFSWFGRRSTQRVTMLFGPGAQDGTTSIQVAGEGSRGFVKWLEQMSAAQQVPTP